MLKFSKDFRIFEVTNSVYAVKASKLKIFLVLCYKNRIVTMVTLENTSVINIQYLIHRFEF